MSLVCDKCMTSGERFNLNISLRVGYSIRMRSFHYKKSSVQRLVLSFKLSPIHVLSSQSLKQLEISANRCTELKTN